MRRRRGRLPVLAEIAGPVEGSRVWSLGRADFEALSQAQAALAGDRVVLVSGDGQLAAAVSLAGAASAGGRRTALLECDLPRPRVAAALGLAATPGLHEYLRWEATAPQILQPLALAGPAARATAPPLVCVVAGAPATGPATSVDHESFRHAIAKLRDAYDLVVLLGPPLEAGRGRLDAVALEADALVAAVPPGELEGRAGRELRAALHKLPVEARGAIVVGDA